MLKCCSTLVVLFWCFGFWCPIKMCCHSVISRDMIVQQDILDLGKPTILLFSSGSWTLMTGVRKNVHKIQMRYELLQQLWYWLKLWRYLFISVFLCVCFHCLRLFCGSICQIKIPGVAGFARSTTNQILMSNLELQLLCSKLGSDRDKWFWNIFDKLQYYRKIAQYNMHLTIFQKS